MRDVSKLARYPHNLVDFIDARRELGLITDPAVDKCADAIERYCYQIEAQALGIPEGKEKPRESNYDKLVARAEKDRQNVPKVGYYVKQSMASRMAQAYDRLVGIDFEQRDVP